MFSVAVGPYVVRCQDFGVPTIFERLKKQATLVVQDEEPARQARTGLCFVSVSRGPEDLLLVVTQMCEPGPSSGFHPGIALILETNILFLGAGCVVQAFDLNTPKKLWQDTADTGFWGWARYGNIVLMSAELELAAWDTQGRKLWTTFVEPPWSYRVLNDVVHLDAMGALSSFDILKGPG